MSLAALGAAGPARAAVPAGPAARGGQPVNHSNVAYPHSPQLLRELSGATRSPAAAAGAIKGARKGVDVASFQHPNGAAINWRQAAAAGIQFTAVKTTEGTYYRNPYALSDLASARAAGMSVYAYAFGVPNGNGGSTSAAAQARYLLSDLGSMASSVTLMLDIEYNPYGSECYGLSQSAMVSWISSFDATIRAASGELPVIYAPIYWWSDCTGGSSAFASVPLWVPDYTSAPSPALPRGWSRWTFWQYSSSGSVAGIPSPGNTDLDQLNPARFALLSPGPLSQAEGSAARQRITAADPGSARPAAYKATGLPPGTAINSHGVIFGWPDATGRYQVSVQGAAALTGYTSFTWAITLASDAGPTGPVRLAMGGECLTDENNRSAAGTRADLNPCSGSSSQRWTRVKDGSLRIHGMCLRGHAQAGSPLELATCTGGTAQQWRLAYPPSAGATGPRPVTLINPYSRLCADDPGWATGSNVELRTEPCTGNVNETWTLPAGVVRSELPGLCLGTAQSRPGNNARVTVQGCRKPGPARNWTAEPDGTVRLNGLCLAAPGVSRGPVMILLRTCSGRLSQQWHLSPSGGGSRLVNADTGRCLTDPANSTTEGSWQQTAACAGLAGQNWQVQ